MITNIEGTIMVRLPGTTDRSEVAEASYELDKHGRLTLSLMNYDFGVVMAGVLMNNALEALDLGLVLRPAQPAVTHSCSCHVKTEGPCVVCKAMACEVWDFNQVAIHPVD